MASVDQVTHHKLSRMGGVGLVNLATLTWAGNIALGRWLRNDIGPLTLASVRFLIASLFFVVLLRGQPPDARRMKGDHWLLLGMGLSGVAAFAPLVYLGLRFTTTVNATLINGLGPLITGILATLLIREPMSKRQFVGAIASLAGVLALISGGSLSFWQALRSSVGDLIVLGAVALWALYSVLGRQVMRRRSALSATALPVFLGLPLLVLAAAYEVQRLPVNFRPALLLPLLYIGIAPTVVGFLSWNAGVRRLGPSGAMVFYNLLPLYGALIGYLLLGEAIGLRHLLGGTLIIGGGLWATWGGKGRAV